MSQGSFKYHKYMIKSAAYGQLPRVIQNLQKIESFDLYEDKAKQAFRQYNEQHLGLVKIDGKTNYPVLKIARDSDGNYINQINRKSYRINHLKRSIQHENQILLQLPQPVLELLQILTQKINSYVDKFYRQPFGSQVFMEITSEGTLNVHLAFTSKNVQLNNFYTGEWNSVWVINQDKIQGKLSISSHIFESGNVQMNHNKQLYKQFKFTVDMQQNATNIMKVVELFESQTQKGLGQVYEQMPTGFFKHLRRIAPVTKTKMIWNVNALKMNKNLHQTQK